MAVQNPLTAVPILHPTGLEYWDDGFFLLDHPPTVLLVDEIEANRQRIRSILKTSPYRILEVSRPSEAFAVLLSEKVDLLIVDMTFPESGRVEFFRRLRTDRRTCLVPILMITGVQGLARDLASIASDADEFLTKPLDPAVVCIRVRAMLRNKLAIDSLDEAEAILFALARAVELRDKETGDHCERLARYSVALGVRLGLSRFQLVALYRGGYLHDIGKISVPDSILFKRSRLTPEEWRIMRNHTIRGEEICRPMKSLAPILPIIRNHHERWDGSGYPDGLRGEDIPLLARILQVADIYDALTTARPYKPAYSHDRALTIMREEAKRGWRDPELVALFREMFPDPPPAATGPVAELVGATPMRRSLDAMKRELLK